MTATNQPERIPMTTETELTNVQAFQPNRDLDEWFFVAETRAEALELADAGATVTGEQCGGCGCSDYQLHRLDGLVFARCIGSEFADAHVDGCGADYLVVVRLESRVVFP